MFNKFFVELEQQKEKVEVCCGECFWVSYII